uniref:MAK10-like protein n=1 Tax=Tanacetum cinerariifolium TaxID=118510 RepID=A0A6L2MM10_TANCI|nr:hypothetical protein [Tanacetum cinerariifolium]
MVRGNGGNQFGQYASNLEYLVKIRKRVHILKLKRRNMKKPIMTSYTPYPSRKIRRICAYTSEETTKLFKTLSLDESRSTEYNLFSDLEENSKEEAVEIIAETMEQYMSKTRADYGSGITRPKIDDKDHFELKGQFLKELKENTFSGLDHEDANEHIEKVLEIVDLFYVPNITQDQVMLRVFPITRSTKTSDGLAVIQAQLNNLGREIKKVNEKVYAAQVGCEQCKGPHYTKDCPLKEGCKTFEEAYYTQFDAPFQQGGQYRAAASGFYQRNNENPSYQEQRQSMKESLSKFMSESAKRYEENSNLIKEIRASTDAAIRNQGASIKTLEIQIGQIRKVLRERGFGSLPRSTITNMRDRVKLISTTVEVDMTSIRRIRSSQYAVSGQQNSKLMFELRRTTILFPSRLNDYYCDEKKGLYGQQCLDAHSYGATCVDDSLPRKEKDRGSFTLPCYINNVCFKNSLADLGTSVSVMPFSTYLNIGLGELAHTKLTVELADRTKKHPKGIAENVLVGFGKFVFPVDFIILDMPEDVKVPLIFRRPFLSTTRAKIDVFKKKITLREGDEKIIFKSVKPASSLIKSVYMLSLNERMELDLEARMDQVYNLMLTIEEGEVFDKPMIDIIKTRNNESFNEYLSFCDFDRKIHIECAYNLRFSCMIVVENMDGCRDQDMGDVIFGEPFYKASCVEARRYDGLITIHNGNDNVTYQMARSHLRFKHLSNA